MTTGSIALDDELLREAQQLSGIKTKRAVVHAALEFLVRLEKQKRHCGVAALEFGRTSK
jgi:Arc/MetJ family transcription regulator